MQHNLEVIDVDGRQFCTRCGTADGDELQKPCPAISDGEMYARGNAILDRQLARRVIKPIS